MEVNVEYSRELMRNIRGLHDEIFHKMKGKVVEVALTKIETPAKQSARVDTGRLRASINTKYADHRVHNYKDDEGNNHNGTLKLRNKDSKTKFDVFVGTNVVYAPYIEARFPFLAPQFLNAKRIIDRELRRIIKGYNPPP